MDKDTLKTFFSCIDQLLDDDNSPKDKAAYLTEVMGGKNARQLLKQNFEELASWFKE
jgi:hypothetical protein